MRFFRVVGLAVTALIIELACTAAAALSAPIPCALGKADYEALTHAQEIPCATCTITKSVVQTMGADQFQQLCAARKLARDLASKTVDQFITAYGPNDVREDPSLYLTPKELASLHDMRALILEKAVGSQARFWRAYSYPDLGFSAEFPTGGTPERMSVDTPTPWGSVKGEGVHTAIIYTELSATVVDVPPSVRIVQNDSVILDEMIKVPIQQMGGKLVSLSKITVSGAPGREFRIENGRFPTVVGRYIWVRSERRLYGLLCANTKHGSAGEPGMKKFLNSLALIK